MVDLSYATNSNLLKINKVENENRFKDSVSTAFFIIGRIIPFDFWFFFIVFLAVFTQCYG